MVVKMYNRKRGNVEWQHTLSMTNQEKEIVDEVIKEYNEQNIEVSFNGALRHIIKNINKKVLYLHRGDNYGIR